MRRFRFLVPLVVLFACKGGDGTGPEVPAKVQVVPGLLTLTSPGATQQFTATAVNDAGDPLVGASVSWRSSNTAVLKVDASGLATAVAEGDASVIATVAGVSGQADVSVDIPDCVQPQSVRLAAGGVLVIDPPSATRCALTLPGGPGTNGDRYRLAVVRVLPTQDGTAVDYAVNVTGLGGATAQALPEVRAPESVPPLSARDRRALEQAAAIADATERVHERLRAGEEALLRRLGPLHPTGIVLPPSTPRSVSPARRTFAPRLPTDIQCAPAPTPVTGVLVAQSNDVAIYQDSAQAAVAPLNPAYAQRMLDFFSAYGRSTIQSYFGAIPDRDGNGQVVVLATPNVSGNIAAFVWGGDQLPKADCPASNEMELVYFNAALINAMANNQFQALETLVHEIKHVVSFHERVVGRAFTTQPTWIEEGTAEIAGEVGSRRAWAAAGGPAPNAMVTSASFGVTPATSTITAENFGVYLRLLRTVQYLTAQPNSLTFATSAAYSIYGSGWLFHRFVGDAYGSAASASGQDAQLFAKQNVAGTTAGIPGLKTVTGKTFADLMAEFAAALMLNGTGAPAPARAFTSYDFVSATAIRQIPQQQRFPFPIASGSFATRRFTGQVGNAGIAIYELTSNGTGTGAEITVQVEAPARVVLVRTR